MSVLNEVVISVAAVIVVYEIIAALLALWTILKRRDESYREKYEEFLRQKHRVQDRLERSKENAS